MNKIKFQKGITLIALIITVVLLIILAAVTIGSVKETDVIGYAQNAAEEYEEKQAEEQGKVTEYKEQIKDVLGATHVTGKVTVDVIAKKNSTINGNVPSSDNPIIPAGFKAINVTTSGQESSWDAEGGPEVDKGLVIEDEDENQFVWVPVPELDEFARLQEGTTENYQGVLYDFLGETATEMTEYGIETTMFREPANLTEKIKTSSDYEVNGTIIPAGTIYTFDSQEMFDLYNVGEYSETMYQETFNEMVKSVSKYGGFYVGRYEMSLNNGKPQSKYGEIPANTSGWYEVYKNSKIYSKSGVITEMIWGCQWDAMMKFIGSKATEKGRVGHGEKEGITFKYRTGGKDYPSEASVKYNDISNNIYDLEGNMREFTQEALYKDTRIFRGDSWRSQNNAYARTPCSRGSQSPFKVLEDETLGSRLALYIV